MSLVHDDGRVQVHHGDCLDVLRTLPDCSVDSVVTDPPSGIAFMGKDWDTDKGGRDHWIAWLTSVLAECTRILKPGGHVIVWALPRTSGWTHRAIEDAGLDVRDCITHLFGSGFPKALDVSRAIDKAAGAQREVTGYESRHINRPVTPGWVKSAEPRQGFGMPGAEQPGGVFPVTAPATDEAKRWEGWATALKPAAEHWYLARKPLVSPAINVLANVESSLRAHGVTGEIRWTRRPASDAARPSRTTTSGSTAPQPTAGTSARTASDSVTPPTESATGSGTARSTPSGEQPTSNSNAPTPAARPPSCETPSSTPTAAAAPAAESAPESSSPLTTSAAEEQPIAGRSTGRCTPRSSAKGSLPVTESFAGIATGLTGSQTHVLISRLEDGSFVWPDGLPTSVPGGPMTVAANVLRHGTGALNIGATRVGMSDADRTRLTEWHERYGERGYAAGQILGNGAGLAGATGDKTISPPNAAGRWPANVVLSHLAGCQPIGTRKVRTGTAVNRNRTGMVPHTVYGDAKVPTDDVTYADADGTETVEAWECEPGCAVAELDRQSGVSKSSADPNRFLGTSATVGNAGGRSPDSLPGQPRAVYGDAGGASRYFPVFRYQAKAPSRERPKVDGVSHPTVKPRDLLRWMVRLVTPPGGVVLDPFAGSGTTAEACLLEGFRCIAIEREAEYLPLILARIERQAVPEPAPAKGKAEQMGLFDDGDAA